MAICKAAASSEATQVGGPFGRDRSGDIEQSQAEAIAALTRMAEAQGRTFEAVLTDPKNAALAAKAHRRPEPTTSFPLPR